MQKQRLQQNQHLNLSPQQIQFLSLLQIPIVSLEKRIEEELEDNPALEESEEENWENEHTLNYRTQKTQEDNRPVLAEREETLQEFLLKQLPLQSLNDEDAFLAEFLIGCLDDNGFLVRDLYAIADDLLFKHNMQISERDLFAVLVVVQSLDPAGVGAQNLQECLLLQLKRKAQNSSILLAQTILSQQYESFSTKNFDKIQRELEVNEKDLKLAFRDFETKPKAWRKL